MAEKWDVFVSYAMKDSTPVSHVIRDLQSSGLSVWQDVSAIQPGSRIREAINEGIQSSKSFLVFLSKRSTRSRWVLNELDAAMVEEISNRRNFVVTVLLGNISTTEIPADIQGKLFIDLRYNFQYKYLVQRTKLIQTLKLLSMAEQSKDYIVLEIGKEFMHFLTNYRYVGYNEKPNFTKKDANMFTQVIIEGMGEFEEMSATLTEFLPKFGSNMAQCVATFVIDNFGVGFTKGFTDDDLFDMIRSTATLMAMFLAAEKLIKEESMIVKIKWTPGKDWVFWSEKINRESRPR